MYPLLRHFSIASAVAFLIATVFFVLIHRQSGYHHIHHHGQHGNVTIARALKNVLWPEFGPYLTSGAEIAGKELREHPLTSRLDRIIRELTAGNAVLKVNIYNRDGLTVFSTQKSRIGHAAPGGTGLASALNGEATSELGRRGQISSFGQILENMHVISTHVPIFDQGTEVVAVIEIYANVSAIMAEFRRDQVLSALVITAIFAFLYFALFLIVRHANRVMVQQHGQILANQTELAGNNQRLAEEIGERERAEQALRDLNDRLEGRVAARTAELRETQETLLRKQRLAGLGQLIGSVCHDLRSPLGVIRNSVALIAEMAEQTELNLKRPLERTERGIGRCESIINDLLDHTRIRDLDLAPTVIDDWLKESFDEQAAPDGIELRLELAAAGAVVDLDGDQFSRVVVNLFDNACQAMTGHPVGSDDTPEWRLTVSSRRSGAQVKLILSDTGPGIPPDLMPKIFEPLFTTKREGVGLGLPMVKQIMEQHGGDIEITSKAGQGTVVTLWLPVKSAAEEAA